MRDEGGLDHPEPQCKEVRGWFRPPRKAMRSVRGRWLRGGRANARHCFQENVLDWPRCHARLEPIAVIRSHDVIERILRHLARPLGPTALGHPDTIAFDVIGEPMLGWVTGVGPEPPDAADRAPPSDWDCVDPPAPDD